MLSELVPLREGEAIDRDLGEVVEDREPVTGGVVVGGAVGDLDNEASGPVDHQTKHVVGGDQVGLDR